MPRQHFFGGGLDGEDLQGILGLSLGELDGRGWNEVYPVRCTRVFLFFMKYYILC